MEELTISSDVSEQSNSTSCDLKTERCRNFSSEINDKTSATHINDLLDDVLFLIFRYLKPLDLCCLCCVNKRFRNLASKDSVWLAHAKQTVVVQPFGGLLSRECSVKELCRIAPNWHKARYKQGLCANSRKRLIPWIVKDGQDLWFSSANVIRRFETRPKGLPSENKTIVPLEMRGDVTKFTVKNNRVVSGCRNGDVYGWDTKGNLLFSYQSIHASDSQCVDFTDDVFISGSRDATCKVVPLRGDNSSDVVSQSFLAAERIWCLKISPSEKIFAAGMAGDFVPVTLWDIESGRCVANLSENHRRGAGVFDLMFESPHELLTCGYDTFLRMWDLRTAACVQQWEEPYDSALFCMTSDGNYAIAVGTARHGMVRLWDRRKTTPLEAFYSHKAQSPVYGVAMDYGHIYLALDKGLNVMNFTS